MEGGQKPKRRENQLAEVLGIAALLSDAVVTPCLYGR